MTWPEIKEALLRRWPERFGYHPGPGTEILYLWIDFSLPSYFMVHQLSLDTVGRICKAVGAVVWSVPFDVPATCYECWFTLPGSEKFHSIEANDVNGYKLFATREDAELAALGEWLKATEEK